MKFHEINHLMIIFFQKFERLCRIILSWFIDNKDHPHDAYIETYGGDYSKDEMFFFACSSRWFMNKNCIFKMQTWPREWKLEQNNDDDDGTYLVFCAMTVTQYVSHIFIVVETFDLWSQWRASTSFKCSIQFYIFSQSNSGLFDV